MAYSFLGTYTGTCTNVLGGTLSNSAFKVDVYYEQSITNNTTSLQIKPYVTKSGHGESVTWYFKLDGNDYYNVFCNTYVNSRVDGGTAYKTVHHNNDGSCTFNLNVSVETSYEQGANANLNNHCMKWGRLSVNVTLPTIPRASDFTISGNTIGSPINVSISRKVSNFTHKVTYKFGTITSVISNNATTSCSFTPALSDANQIPNSTKGSATLVVDTYNGSTLIGSKSQTFDLYVPSSMYPVINQISVDGIDEMGNQISVAGISKVTISVLSANSVYGATIKSYSINGPGLNVNASSGTSSVLSAGTNTYTVTVTDSRGRSATKTASIVTYAYSKPSLSGLTAYRCTTNGTETNDGSNVNIIFTADIQNTAGANINSKSWCVDWRIANGAWNNNWKSGVLSNYHETVTVGPTPGWDVTKSYEIRVRLFDYYSADVNAIASIGTSSCAFNIEDGGIGIGKYWEKGGLDVKGSIYTDGEVAATGSIGTHGSLYVDGFVNAGANITSQGSIFGTTFIQHSANYGTPLEVGRYIDLHNAGSTNDVDVRLDTGGTRDRLRISGGTDLSRYVEIGMNSNGSFLRDSPSGKYIQLRTDRLIYDGATVPHNWRQNFTPFIFSDTGNFNMVESWGEAVYLGDLVWIRGRVRGSRGGHSGSVYIGGLPVSCIAGYPALDIAFFGGVTGNLGNSGFDIRAYLENKAGHCVITYSNKDTGGWHNLQCSHVTTGNMDISFSAIYRWR